MKAGFWKKLQEQELRRAAEEAAKALETRGAQVEAELLRIQSLLPDYQELENLEGRLKKAEADRKKLESASDFWQEKRKAGKEETEELKKCRSPWKGRKRDPRSGKRLRELSLAREACTGLQEQQELLLGLETSLRKKKAAAEQGLALYKSRRRSITSSTPVSWRSR
ncbi:MAG: hypothetical protein ACLR2E_06345 [Lachnospiraceae bacterium]